MNKHSIFSVVSFSFCYACINDSTFFISNKLHDVFFFSFFCIITKMKTVFTYIIWPSKRTYIATDTQNIFTMQNRYISHIFWEEEAMRISKWSPLMWELDRKREKSERTRRQHIETDEIIKIIVATFCVQSAWYVYIYVMLWTVAADRYITDRVLLLLLLLLAMLALCKPCSVCFCLCDWVNETTSREHVWVCICSALAIHKTHTSANDTDIVWCATVLSLALASC